MLGMSMSGHVLLGMGMGMKCRSPVPVDTCLHIAYRTIGGTDKDTCFYVLCVLCLFV